MYLYLCHYEVILHFDLCIVTLSPHWQRGKKTLNEPSPQVTLCVGQQVELSMIKQNTCEPKWEQNFRFMLHNPNYQNLDIEVGCDPDIKFLS